MGVSIRYKDLYDVDLKTVVKKETSGGFGMALKFCSFDPIVTECAMLKEGCKGIGSHKDVLYSILCGRSNEEKMFKVISLSPPVYLKMVNDTYADKYGYTL